MEHTISEIATLIQKGFLQKSDIVHLMVLIRVLLEEENAETDFPYLFLYSTWVVHPKLTRNLVCLNILVDLTKVISTPDDISAKLEGALWLNYFHNRINEAMGLSKLREEIIKAAGRFGFPNCNLEKDNTWKDFVLILISCLFERPIKLPVYFEKNKNARDALDSGVVQLFAGKR